MTKKKILFIDIIHPVFKTLVEERDFVCEDGTAWSKKEIIERIHEYTGIVIRSRFKLDEEILTNASDLKFIARAGAGMENIDVSYATSKNVICINSPEGNRDSVGEHAAGMLLSLLNNLNKADREVRNGIWMREENRGTELHGKTMGIIGFGNTGSAFAKKLSGFELKIIAYDKYITIDKVKSLFVEQVSLEKIFDESDILSLHLPLTDETLFMINHNFLSRFKKNIYIINTSRGKVLKTSDLVKEIQSGKVKGACLDVFDFEDTSFEKTQFEIHNLPNESEQAKSEFFESFQYLVKSDKVILSPHIAGWTYESNEKIARVLVEKILKLF